MRKLLMFFSIMLIILFVTSCNFNNNGNNTNPNDENNITPTNYEVTYYLNDNVYYKCESLNTEELFLPRFISYYRERKKLLGEVEWYDGETLVTSEYRLESDVSLHAQIMVEFEFGLTNIAINELVYTNKKHITIPKTYYSSYIDHSYDPNIEDTYKIQEFDCKLSGNIIHWFYHFWGDDTYFLGRHADGKIFDVEELTVYADTFSYGIISPYSGSFGERTFFGNSDSIKRINIIGDVFEIRYFSFTFMPNLESIKVYGNVGYIEEGAVIECNDVQIEVIPNVIETSNDGIDLVLKIDNQIYYQNKLKSNQNLNDFSFIRDYQGITGDINNIMEVEWYHNNTLLDDNYEITNDIELVGKIKTVLKCEKEFIIRKVIYNATSTVTIPSKCLNVIELNNEQLLEFRKCKIYDAVCEVIWGNDDLYQDVDANKNDLLTDANIEHLIIYSDCFILGISTNTFSNNEIIKQITIKGSVNAVRNNGFYNLPNLEKVIIEGNIAFYSDNPVTDCNITIKDFISNDDYYG